MKRIYGMIFALSLMMWSITPAAGREKPSPADTPGSQQEMLNRGFVRIQTGSFSPFLSWRLLNTDDEHTSFVILKDEVPLNSEPLRNATSYRPSLASASNVLKLVTLQNGVPVDTIEPQIFNAATHHVLQMQEAPKKPSTDSKLKDLDYSYTPNDCSVGDVDGDGEYEIIVKWYPTNAKDNSQSGVTGYIYFDCYKIFTGERLWRINLGKNIRAGAHYNPFLVYDFDGDGKAEFICKTAPGSRDGVGNYVSTAATEETIKTSANGADNRTDAGRINGGYEYLTVFNGETGAAIHTIPYLPNRNAKYELSSAAGTFNWYISGGSDTGSYGNRGERYLAGVAYLDGPDSRPSAVMCRGMYTRSYLWAVDFDGAHLSTKWIHASLEDNTVQLTDAAGNTTSKKYTSQTGGGNSHARYNAYGQGAHSLTIGDVDGDGCDEIIYGSATVDNDGWMLYSTGFGHGDAEHLGDLDPDRPGMEIFMVHEENPYGAHLIDAETGKVIWSTTGSEDNGRGLAANIVDEYRGYEFWSAKVADTRNVHDSKTIVLSSKYPSMNFRCYWDGDPLDELLDGTSIRKYKLANSSFTNTELGIYTSKTASKTFSSIARLSSCNSTKATPCLQADILGDWREEVVWYNTDDPTQLMIFSSTTATDYRVPCLMYDHNYRMAIAWQNSGYNQPPHLSYYLPDWIDSFQGIEDDPSEVVTVTGEHKPAVRGYLYYNMSGQQLSAQPASGLYIEKTIYADGSSSSKKIIKR